MGQPPAPPPDDLTVLEHLCRAAGVPFDPTRAAQTLRAAVRDIPPTETRAARRRVAAAAEGLGVQVVGRSLSVREAIAAGVPLAVFAVTPFGTARWFVLDAGGKLVALQPGDPEGRLPADELARTLGARDADAVLDWQFGQPATPLAEATSEPHAGHDHHDDHAHHPPPFRRLLGLLRPERGDIAAVFLYALGIGLLTLATPIVAMAVVNTVALGTLLQQLVVLCGALFAALGLAAVLQLLQTVCVEYVQRRVFVRVAADLAYRLPRVDLRAFDRQHGPELVNRFFDVLTVQKASATLLLDGIAIGLQVLIGLLLLGYYHTLLLGFDLILLASLAVLFFVLSRGAVRTAVRESIAKYAVAGWMEEVARHPVAFKTAGGPTLAAERADALTREYLEHRTAHFRILLRQIGFALFLQAAANVGLLAVGGVLVTRGELTLGELVAAEIVVTLVVATFTKLGKQLEAFYDLLAATDKLGHLIDLPLERVGGERHRPQTGGAAVEVRDVSFTYDGTHHPALNHLNLTLKPGERVALTGPNGAGKSTLADVLFGLRRPAAGWVTIDGADLRTVDLATLREHVAVVKGIEAVEGTVLDNVRMGRDDVSASDAREALRQVGLLETIMRLPDGLDTQLWTGGAPLSLGQANRLMLARAVAGRPRLLVLDEALDHMDADIRETVLPAVLGPEARWTVLVVTHSAEAARLCDRTVTLDTPH